MLPYIFLLLISIICLFFPNKRWAQVVSILSILIISAFRGENVGTDTIEYLNDIRIVTIDFNQLGKAAEFISNGFSLLVVSAGLPGRFVVFFYSLITIGIIPYISRRIEISPVFLCFMFLVGQFVVSLNICRQVAASMLVGLASTYIFEKDIKKSLSFFILIFVATGIHSTSLVYGVLYLFRFVKIRYGVAILIFLIVLVLNYVFGYDLGAKFNDLMAYSGMYEKSYSDIFISEKSRLSIFGYIMPICIAGVQLHLLKNEDVRFLPMYIFAICMPLFFQGADSMVGRLLIPCGIISNFILAIGMNGNYGENMRKVSLLMVIPLSYMLIRSIAVNNQILPYYFGF